MEDLALDGTALEHGAFACIELVETRCAVCHDLERVTIVKRQPRDWETIVGNMYERWGMSAPDEVRTITSYLAAQFGRD